MGKFSENLSKILENLGKIPANLCKISKIREKMVPNVVCLYKMAPVLFVFTKWRPMFAEKVHTKKVFMILVGQNLQAKVAQNLFGQVWGYAGNNPSHPHKFACSYTYVSIIF